MNYFNEQVERLARELYPKTYLVRQVMDARKFMDSHYDRRLRLAEIASAACISQFHFTRLFKLYYGQTPYQYLAQMRISRAKQLLENDETIAGACNACGFESISYFTRLFRQMTGLSPAAFKKRLKKSNIGQEIKLPILQL